MAHVVELHDDPAAALDAAHDHLAGRPVEHNLILTLLRARVVSPEPGRYWLVREGGDVVGVAFLSPIGFFVTVTPMPAAAVDALAAALTADGVAVAGVTGEAATAARFAGQWTEIRGTAAVPDMGMRIYRLGELLPPADVAGHLRQATMDDLDVVLEMIDGFHRDTGEASVAAPGVHEARIDAGAYALWDDDGPRALAGRTEPVGGMSRVYAVFTPPEWRRRGYAGAAVAELSAWIRADGADAMLFTDLGNPISNSVYRRIGYRAVAENLRYRFA